MILIMALGPTAMLLSTVLSRHAVLCSILGLWFPTPGERFLSTCPRCAYAQGVLYITLSCMSFTYLLRGHQLTYVSHELLSKAVMVSSPAQIPHSPFIRAFGCWEFGVPGLVFARMYPSNPASCSASQGNTLCECIPGQVMPCTLCSVPCA